MRKHWREPSARAQVLLERARVDGMENLSAADWDFLIDNSHHGVGELDSLISSAMHSDVQYDEVGNPLKPPEILAAPPQGER